MPAQHRGAVPTCPSAKRCGSSADGSILRAAPPRRNRTSSSLERWHSTFTGNSTPVPDSIGFWELAHPPRVDDHAQERARPAGLSTPWGLASGGWKSGRRRLAEEAARHYDGCAAAFRELMGQLATAIVSVFSAELDELIERFETFKRSAAVLDFDDLLVSHARRPASPSVGARRRGQAIYPRSRGRVSGYRPDPGRDHFPFDKRRRRRRERWHERRLLPGRLFMVGDPKQAIYRFRGADIATYRLARAAIERQFPGNVLRVACKLSLLRRHLAAHQSMLSDAAARPGVGLRGAGSHAKDAEHGLPGVVKVKVDVVPQSRVDDIRDEEAQIVAETCARLIGNIKVRGADRGVRILSAGDIALLAPTGRSCGAMNGLWRKPSCRSARKRARISTGGRKCRTSSRSCGRLAIRATPSP